MKDNTQSRKYQLTINNPRNVDITSDMAYQILMEKLSLDYFCLAEEIGNETHTLHMHIILYSHAPIRFSTIKNIFPFAHIEKAHGTIKENRAYILKEGKWKDNEKAETSVEGTFREWGDIPTEGMEQEPLKAQIIRLIEEGFTTAQIIKSNPKFAFNVKDIDIIREMLLSEKYMFENRHVEVIYIYGKTGMGKTRSVYENHQPCDVCRITNYSNNGTKFDAYHGQDVLVFEEFNSQIPIQEMLIFLDIYPVMLPARYTDRVACFTHVYILSNISLSEQYISIRLSKPEIWNAFLRRISKIYQQIGIGERKEIGKDRV